MAHLLCSRQKQPTVSNWVCKFTSCFPALHSIGATTMEQLKEDIDAFENVELDADTLAAIDAIHLQARGTGCWLLRLLTPWWPWATTVCISAFCLTDTPSWLIMLPCVAPKW